MRTLFVHTGGIGDFIAACPAVEALSREGDVVLAGYRARLELAVAGGIASAAHDLDAIDFGSAFSTPSARLMAFLQGFGRAVVWMRDDDGRMGEALRKAGVGERHCFPGLPGAEWHAPAWRYYLACLGLPDTGPPRLVVPASERVDEVVVHPGSGGRKKCWGVEHFTRIVEDLEQRGLDVRWCVGPAEAALDLAQGARMLPPLSLVELAKHLAGVRAYVGNDSGITHLAAAVGCPTVAVFGCTDPEVWGPRGEHVRVLGDMGGWPGEDEVLHILIGLMLDKY